MTTLATGGRTAVPAARPRVTVRPVTFGRLVASEWVKFRSLRSTWWTLGVGVAFMVALAVLQTWGTSTMGDDAGSFPMAGTDFVTGGWILAQLAFCVLGVLAITGEYSTGMVRATFAAAPRRLPVLWAKLVVVFLAVLVASLVGIALSWAGSAPWFGELNASIELTDPEDLRRLLGTALYLATATALAYAIGALVRHTAAGLSIIFGLLLVLENVLPAIPWRPTQELSPFLPSRAGQQVLLDSELISQMGLASDTITLTPWQGYGVMVAWVAVLLAVAAVLLRRRDA